MTEAPRRERIGHYIVEAPLGRGSMGAVYLGRDQRIGRRVALKQLQIATTEFDDPAGAAEFYMRLQREAEVCGALQHPNIVTLYDVGYEGDRISYLALEYVAGETLFDLLKRHRPSPLPVDMALRIAADVLRGLAYAHAKGIVHRDIKPANILIGRDGMAKIADFGIARPQHSSMTVAGAVMGTPNYMSPEQVNATPATTRSDLFSLGVLLFEMVTGTKPFAAIDITATLDKIVRMPTPSAAALNPEVSPELDALIQRLTAKMPEERFATAGEALEAVERLRSPAPLLEQPSTPPAPELLRPSLLRRPIPAQTFLIVVLAAAILAATPAVVIWSRIDDTPTVRHTPEELAEFARKQEALAAAEELYRSGEYAQSLELYEEYVARYPHSTVAREGAERARSALQSVGKGQPRPPAQKRVAPSLRDIKRSVKRLFRGK